MVNAASPRNDTKITKPTISLIYYSEATIEFLQNVNLETCKEYKNKPDITWINVDGLYDVELINQLCGMFTIHPLIIEDILNTKQLPKIDIFENYIFISLDLPDTVNKKNYFVTEQISLVIGSNFLLTFREKKSDVFDLIYKRLENPESRLRKFKTDFLAYALIDTIVDKYFETIEDFGNVIEETEQKIMKKPKTNIAGKIHTLRRDLISLRKSIWPLRSITTQLQNVECSIITDNTRIYLRDLYDHVMQILDSVENYRDLITSIFDSYLMNVSNHLNDIMKVLTIFASIFIPMTFVASLYGMNFNPSKSPYNMPELNWYYGYPAVLLVMALIAIGMLIFFRKKKWL